MTPGRHSHVERVLRVTTLAVVLALVLGPAANMPCLTVCGHSSAVTSGCHHNDANGKVTAAASVACHSSMLVAAALPADASGRTSPRVAGGLGHLLVGRCLSDRRAFRPLDPHVTSPRHLNGRSLSTVLRI
jgi:hypothetical protein